MAVRTVPARATPPVTGVQLATAFDGQLARRSTSVLYRIGLAALAFIMVLLPVVYVCIIAGAVWLVAYHATHSTAMFNGMRGGRIFLLLGVIYIAPIIAGALLVLFMILPLFWRSKETGPKPFWIDRREEPLLYAYIDKLCDVMRAPRPDRIDITAAANASAHIDNGLLGLFRRRLVLTIGLPLARSLNLRQFTGVLAHELGHFTQGSSMRMSYVVHRINAWFAGLAYGRSGIDDMLDEWVESEAHWSISLVALLCKATLGLARLVLKTLALISHALSMNLSRQAEYDADWQAARIVGGDAMGEALQAVPFLDVASGMALEKAQQGWQRRSLPDDLVILTHAFQKRLPTTTRDEITESILTSEASWFDTHPPLYKRVAALKKTKLQGVLKLDARATCLFKDFDDLSKMATLDIYQNIVGEHLRPEHLVPTAAPAVPQKQPVRA